jgi:hypothetical protein
MASDMSRDPASAASRQQGLDPGAVAVIRQSAALLSRDRDAFTRQLHLDVTGLIPDTVLPAGFDMWEFCDRMGQALLWVALTDQPARAVIDALRQLGAYNWLDGFPDAQYASVAHALIQTVHYLSANIWSTSTGSAWISFFMWTQPHLLAGAREAAASEAASQEASAREAAAERAAAEQEAARVAALSHGQTKAVGDVNIEKVASLLDDDDDEAPGLGQLMVNMTRSPRRDSPRRHQQ